MQCPLSRCSLMVPKIVFLEIGVLTLAVGMISLVSPKRSIGLYQWIMRRINWNVEPIDARREVRNTRIFGAILTVLSLIIFHLICSRG